MIARLLCRIFEHRLSAHCPWFICTRRGCDYYTRAGWK
jgi:hypothetical protein